MSQPTFLSRRLMARSVAVGTLAVTVFAVAGCSSTEAAAPATTSAATDGSTASELTSTSPRTTYAPFSAM